MEEFLFSEKIVFPRFVGRKEYGTIGKLGNLEGWETEG